MSESNGPGATLSGSGLRALKVFTDGIVLGDVEARQITHDPTVDEIYSLPSSYALAQAISYLSTELQKIDPDNNFFKDNSVITLALSSLAFDINDDDWEIMNWTIADSLASYTAETFTVDNFIQIPNRKFTSPGRYFVHVKIPRLDSGKLCVYDHSDTKITEIVTYGAESFDFDVTNIDIQTLRFVAEDVFPGELIVVESIWVHKVTARLYEYLQYLFRSGGGTGVTQEQLAQAIAESQSNVQVLINTLIAPVVDAMQMHLQEDNPHGITPAQIGAALTVHTHTPVECGAAPTVHNHTPEECDAAAIDHTHSPESIGAAPLVHTHTPESIGAAPEVHLHSPEECGAAPTDHDHEQYVTEDAVQNLITTTVTDMISDLDVTTKIFVPMTVAECAVGSLPDQMEESSLSAPICPILFPYIVHRTNDAYDYFEGVASTNILPLETNPIQYAFKKHLTEEDYTANVAAFSSTVEDLSPYVLIEYYFHTQRSISGYTFFKDLTNVIEGVPTAWDLVVDGRLIQSFEDLSWYSTENFVTDTLTEPVVGRRFSFIIKKAHITTANNWGARIEFSFDDVPTNSIAINSLISLVTASEFGTSLQYVTQVPSFDPGITEENTPLYLSLITDTENMDAQFSVSPMRTEYSEYQRGVDGLMNRFTSKTNYHWGEVSVTSEDPSHLVENLYSDGSEYWKTVDGVKFATISHEFVTPQTLIGHTFVFSDIIADANLIPDEWEFTVTDVNDTVYVIDSVTSYYPSRFGGASKQVRWNKRNYAITNVKSFELSLVGTRDQPAIGLWKLIPWFKGDHYNIRTGVMTPENKFPFGRLDFVKSFDNSWNGFVHSGVVLGDYCHVPIDGFRIQPGGIVTHEIPNPFNTREIDFELYSYSVPGSVANAQVDSITPDSIKVYTMASGRYSIRISRIW